MSEKDTKAAEERRKAHNEGVIRQLRAEKKLAQKPPTCPHCNRPI